MREAVDPTGHRCIKRLSYIERSQERREERSYLNNYVAEKFEPYIAEISRNFVTLSAFKNNFRLKFDRVMNFFRNKFASYQASRRSCAIKPNGSDRANSFTVTRSYGRPFYYLIPNSS